LNCVNIFGHFSRFSTNPDILKIYSQTLPPPHARVTAGYINRMTPAKYFERAGDAEVQEAVVKKLQVRSLSGVIIFIIINLCSYGQIPEQAAPVCSHASTIIMTPPSRRGESSLIASISEPSYSWFHQTVMILSHMCQPVFP
jgi:hypothetical protein